MTTPQPSNQLPEEVKAAIMALLRKAVVVDENQVLDVTDDFFDRLAPLVALKERDELRAELLTTHQMACRVGLERDELAKMLETECNTLQVELVEAERKFQDGFDCVPFCELSSAANALLSRIRAALQSLRALTE
jgi:hypothetical protein